MQINRRLGNKTFAHSSLLAGVEKIYISMNIERVSSSSQHFLFLCDYSRADCVFHLLPQDATFSNQPLFGEWRQYKITFSDAKSQVPLPVVYNELKSWWLISPRDARSMSG
jgi:hypothetical protein